MVLRGHAEVALETMCPGMGLTVENRGAGRVSDDLIVATIRTRVRRFMLEELEENGFREEFSNDESLLEKQVLDSLSILKLISFLDENYGIYLSEEEIDPVKLGTINLIAEMIREKLASK